MKNIIRKSAIAASLVLALAASSVQAQSNTLVYDRKANSAIGISSDNAVGCNYEIKDKKGNVVASGKIRSAKTFYINTGKLNKGFYRFSINGSILQEFIIK